MNLTIFDIANWFLFQESMTHKKLQKLCYYAYSWFIYLNNDDYNNIQNRLFEEKFEAWVHGPVNRALYTKYAHHGWKNIPKSNKIPENLGNIDGFLQNIWQVYGKYNGDQLESISHQEKPWQNARIGLEPYESSNKWMSEIDMFMEYASR